MVTRGGQEPMMTRCGREPLIAYDYHIVFLLQHFANFGTTHVAHGDDDDDDDDDVGHGVLVLINVGQIRGFGSYHVGLV